MELNHTLVCVCFVCICVCAYMCVYVWYVSSGRGRAPSVVWTADILKPDSAPVSLWPNWALQALYCRFQALLSWTSPEESPGSRLSLMNVRGVLCHLVDWLQHYVKDGRKWQEMAVAGVKKCKYLVLPLSGLSLEICQFVD